MVSGTCRRCGTHEETSQRPPELLNLLPASMAPLIFMAGPLVMPLVLIRLDLVLHAAIMHGRKCHKAPTVRLEVENVRLH